MMGNNAMMKPCLKTLPTTAPLVMGLALFIAAPAALAQTTVAGVTSGALSVDETGSAGYTIPIAVPPGIAGMQPALALVYKSHGGNSTAGVGWSLSASSSIHRCSQTLAQDGAIHGVDFSAEDRFCLDGQRLVAVSGVYGADGTEYRTEIDGFARIISHGVAGSGPERFTVESKSGQTLDYGNTTDSRLGVPGASEIRLWSLNRVTDSLGNAMTYHYIEDPADKSYRLDKIAYAYDAAVTTAKSEVRLIYETRPDTRTSYLAGAELAMTRRLSKVETWTDTDAGLALVKDYRLAYEVSPATSRSRITSITECDTSDNCLEPMSLGWQMGTAGWQIHPGHVPPTSIYHHKTSQQLNKVELADVNGDGLPDWVMAYVNSSGTHRETRLNTGSGWQVDPGYQLPTAIYDLRQSSSLKFGDLADINGDGLVDWVFAYGKDGGAYGLTTYLNTGSGWQIDPGYAPPTSIYHHKTSQQLNKVELADVNGDGLPDWVMAYVNSSGTHRETRLNTGSGWQVDPGYQLPTAIYDLRQSSSLKFGDLADINGDGLVDWVFAYGKDGGAYGLTTYLNTGSGWQIDPGYAPPTSIYHHKTSQQLNKVELADVNGDGLPDWIMAYVNSSGTHREIRLNTGNGWQVDPDYQLPTAIYDNRQSSPLRLGELIDVNGDGLVDWVLANANSSGTSRQTWLNTGSGWQEDISYQVPTAIYDNRFLSSLKFGDFVDISGDGLPDWVLAYGKDGGGWGLSTYLSDQLAPDLLTSVTDSLGRVSTLSYTPLTDDAVYSKNSNAVFPVVDVQAPLYVVKSVSSDDGLGGQAVTSYSYAGAKVHVQGRGFRGFRQMTATDEQSGIVTTTDYHQVFPYTAQVTQSVKTLADGTTIKTIDNTWDQLSLNGGATVYPYVASSVSEDYEINDGLGNSPVVSRSASAVFDTYGNPTSLTTTTSGGGESFTETTVNTYTNDTTNWFLGLLTRSEVTRSRGTTP